ncbi:MAG: UDP-2,3-diacylglucosamine diphosphatase [Legionellales bacterium RIFCSPHIGHO2_12_FULL_37_14]|nr:MAG: UDP-2,3-diacylglucosamine diphosphatase [Legionellales bacterium RIFCSPHIGHO2_12_FULL_37_14]
MKYAAIFISDLHLHPSEPLILERFTLFIEMAKNKTKAVYILGDFIHAWPGDDAIDDWSRKLANLVAELYAANVKCYFMPGNRDFLLGEKFATLAKWQVLPDPYVIHLNNKPILLSHGDRFCTKDWLHQVFMFITRGKAFSKIFCLLPLNLRNWLVKGVRGYSSKRHKSQSTAVLDVVNTRVIQDMALYNTQILIHGHTHRPNVHQLIGNKSKMTRFVLSDWDDNPALLCYNDTQELIFKRDIK